jgi:hypothetical protein
MDLDAWRAINPTWSLTLDGYTYRARPVSARAVAEWVVALGKATADEQFRLYEKLYRLAFPWVPSYLWRGDPVAKIMALPPAAFVEVKADFFHHLGVAKQTRAPEMSTTTSST